jgi:hypothetical protein
MPTRLGWIITGDANHELTFASADGQRVMASAPDLPAAPGDLLTTDRVNGRDLEPEHYYPLDLDAAMWAVGPKHFPMN